MEPDPLLNRFFWPVKLNGIEFAETVLLNEPNRLPKHNINESKMGISAPSDDN